MTMGIVSKGSPCNVQGCDGTAVRSLNTKKVEDAGFRLILLEKNLVYVKNITKNGKRQQKKTAL